MEVVYLFNGRPNPDCYSAPAAEVFNYIKKFKAVRAGIVVNGAVEYVFDLNSGDLANDETEVLVRERVAAAVAKRKAGAGV